LTSFERKYQIVPATLLVFVDASEDSIMVDDVATLTNPPVALVKKEKLNMNVSQRSHKEKPS
jgi:hypothetical protein